MKLDVFYEFCQGADNPLRVGADCDLFDQVLEQAVVADAAGFNCFWSVEHHGATPFSHMSAPEQMLTAVAMRTTKMRVGHAAALTPYKTNSPIRLAERAAMLDNLSHGRLEMGFARSTPREWKVMDAVPEDTRPMLEEALTIVPRMWTEEVFSYESQYISIPPVTIVPRVLQQPHPPMWVTATNPEAARFAGKHGLGMLTLSLTQPLSELSELIATYREAIREAKDSGKTVNDRVAAFTYVYCAEREHEVIAHGAPDAAGWYLEKVFSYYRRTVPEQSTAALAASPLTQFAKADSPTVAILNRLSRNEAVSQEEFYETYTRENQAILGTPTKVVRQMREYQDIGLDHLLCFIQGGPSLSHENIIRSLKLMGEEVLPTFHTK